MATCCVLGAQWGDEGKARVVDLLADTADIVVRYQGGGNAGHTVVFEGETYRLHLIPSGILRPTATCVVAHGVVVDCGTLLDEVEELRKRGVHVGENLVISDRAHVVMPWHKRLDIKREEMAGSRAHGTTGRGIGPCYADKVSYRGIRVGDLYEPEWFAERLRMNIEEKNRLLVDAYGGEPLDFEAIRVEYMDYAERIRPFVGDAVTLLHDAIDAGKNILFEGAQGVLLDVDLGSYPYVTGSNSCALGVPSGTGVPPKALDRVIGVAKVYMTRVGTGPFPTEDEGEGGQRLRDAGHEYGTTTGRPRRCGWFDAVAMRYSVRSNGIDEVVLVKLDVLRGFESIRVCTAYETADGERIERMPATASQLNRIVPVYVDLPGFEEDVTGARKAEDLPQAALDLLAFIEKEIGAPISQVSVGPSREQIVRMNGAD
jgi:adenylosuccinate synthase